MFYITKYVVLYNICHAMLYNMCHVTLCNICHVFSFQYNCENSILFGLGEKYKTAHIY